MGFPARHRCADFNGAVASATIFHRHPSWGNPGQGVACVGDLWTRDRATQFGSSNGSERILAVRTAHGWLSIRDGPAVRDPGAHNDLTVGRHWCSSASWFLVGWKAGPLVLHATRARQRAGTACWRRRSRGRRRANLLLWKSRGRYRRCGRVRRASSAWIGEAWLTGVCRVGEGHRAQPRPGLRSAPPCVWLRRPGPASLGAT